MILKETNYRPSISNRSGAGSVTCWPSRSMQAAAATGENLTEAWQMVSGRQSARRMLTLQ